jgi:hypothetical protein
MFGYFCPYWGPECFGKWAFPLGLCLVQICSLLFLCIFYPIWPTYMPFPCIPCKTSGTPKLVEYVSVKPYSLSLVFVLFNSWWYKLCNKDHQQLLMQVISVGLQIGQLVLQVELLRSRNILTSLGFIPMVLHINKCTLSISHSQS